MDGQFLHIAGFYYSIPSSVKLTSNYLPFKHEPEEPYQMTSTVTVGDFTVSHKELCHKGLLIDTEKELCIYKTDEKEGGYYVTVKDKPTGNQYELYASSDWSHVQLSSNCISDCPPSVIDILMMLIFIYSAAPYNTILLHASCVKCGDEAVAFIGHSGAGKSTHSQLWLKYIPGTYLLNDDQPAVRAYGDGTVMIYGTPWSGKTPCYKYDGGILKGIIRMKQASNNKITALDPISLFKELLSSCSMMKSDPTTFKAVASALAAVASHMPGFVLENKPEKEAAMMSYSHTIKKEL